MLQKSLVYIEQKVKSVLKSEHLGTFNKLLFLKDNFFFFISSEIASEEKSVTSFFGLSVLFLEACSF